MQFLAQIIIWFNVIANATGKFLLAPIAVLPGWLSITIISAVVGVLLLIVFKYTSNQTARGRVKDDIKADLLVLKLFKDSMAVILKAQGRVFGGAILLFVQALVPMLVMIVPVSLMLGQMGLWYQFRPLQSGERAVVTMKLSGEVDSPWPKVSLMSSPSAKVIIGPVRSFTKREINWEIRAVEDGCYNIIFQVDDHQIEKELLIGEGFMRLSTQRPGWHWLDILLHPSEKPFARDSIVQSISIDYPKRSSGISGADGWFIYFFIISWIFVFIFKPFLKVSI